MEHTGKCVIVSAPSGAGKTTIVRHLIDQGLGLAFSVSATCRAKRAHEVDGRDYFFISVEEFRERIGNGAFVEWEEVYPGEFYGTLRTEIDRIWAEGHSPIFDVDVVGGLHLKGAFGDRALGLFVVHLRWTYLSNASMTCHGNHWKACASVWRKRRTK